MRKTITGTGGMLLLQTLKDAGVEYLFTNPGSAETGIFAALAEDGEQRLVVGKHEGLVAAMADGYHRMSGKVGVIIAHVMGGSFQLAGQLFNAQVAGSSVLVIAGDWTSELQDHRGLAPFPGLSQAESMRPLTKEARCAYQVDANPAAITVATARALREATTPPTGPVYLSISAELLNREGLAAQIGEAAQYRIEGVAPARPETVEAMARRLGEARCPVLMFGDDVWRQGAQAEAVRLAEVLEAPVFSTRQIFANFPSRHPLYCGMYPVSSEFGKVSGLEPDLLFLVGCQGVHGSVVEPCVMQIGPNPVLMGRHYPLDVAAQCELRRTLRDLGEALTRLHPSERVATWARQRARVRAYARLLIEREEDLVREHEHDAIVHPSLLEAQMTELLPRSAIMVQESSTARTTLLPFGYQAMGWTRSGGGSLGWGVGGAIGAKIAAGRERPVVLHLGDGALTYSAAGFWTMARYNTAVLTIVSNNETYQVVRTNWAREAPDSKMVREGRYPGLYL
ncbi:MAG TPA: thiamine pyrophosphate-binding protein, partial [Gemmatimonadales bacterium]|nr:thiamine pyrophosphate-binding protein [Gemmatimonadales bacterium]